MPSLTDGFVGEVKQRVLSGQWPAGMRLPSSRELAEEFMVSRSVINRGITELCDAGYLKTVPRKYICVANWKENGNFAQIQDLLANGLCEMQFFDDIFESRMSIGRATVIKAAAARTENDLLRIRRAIDSEKICRSPRESARADREFHCAIAAASHNIIYMMMHNNFNTLADSLALEFYECLDDRQGILELHEKIYESICCRNPAEAERNLVILLSGGEAEMRKLKGRLERI